MKYKVLVLCACLGLMGSVRSENSLETFLKICVGAGFTAGFGYALWQLYTDISTDEKRYVQTEHYVQDNQERLVSDSFSVIGLSYLTFQSGISTVESMKNLIDLDDQDQKREHEKKS